MNSSSHVAASMSTLPLGDARVTATVEAFDTLGGVEIQFAFLEVLTHFVRDEGYRKRLATMYQDTAAIVSLALGGYDERTRQELEPYSRSVLAFLDGVFIQQLTAPDYDFSAMVDNFAMMLRPVVARILAYEEGDGDGRTRPGRRARTRGSNSRK